MWFTRVKKGDVLTPIPEWNKSTTARSGRQLPGTVEVLDSYPAASQSSWLFKVASVSGSVLTLDLAWFYPPEEACHGSTDNHTP